MWFYAQNKETLEKYQALVPLKEVVIKGMLNGAVSTVHVQLTYVNSSEESPIECSFDFPL